MNEFTVYIDDNFHSPGAPLIQHGVFADYHSAVAACKRIIDEFVADALRDQPNLSAEDLRRQFAMFGDEPFISPSPDEGRFSAREYLAQRCEEMAAYWSS